LISPKHVDSQQVGKGQDFLPQTKPAPQSDLPTHLVRARSGLTAASAGDRVPPVVYLVALCVNLTGLVSYYCGDYIAQK
jgi:hypothetical protein